MGFLKDQTYIDLQSPMPVDDLSMSSSVVTAPSETVIFLFDSSGTRTTDAGEVAGTPIQGRLSFKNVLNVSGSAIATSNDTSLAFTSAALTDEVAWPTAAWEKNKDASWADKLAAMTADMANGEFAFNYRTGEFCGKKATTAFVMTAVTYDINQGQTGASGGLSGAVDLTKIGGVAVPVDDAAFTEGTTPVIPAGFIYDDAAVLDSGDVGAARVTLDRKQIGAAHDTSTSSDKMSDIADLSTRYELEDLADTTNITAATHYYPSSTGTVIDTHKDNSLTGKFIDADGTLTLTLEVTNDEDSSGADWVSAYFYDDKNNVTTNAITVTNGTLTFAVSANNNNFKRYRWVVVADGATNTVIAKGRKKAL